MKNEIYIYKGAGASSISAQYLKFSMQVAMQQFGYKVQFIGPKDLQHEKTLNNSNVKMLIVGGGSFTEFKKAIGSEAFNNIRRFVYDGGKYCGVCMGGYGAFADIDFHGLEKRTGTGFTFFNTIAHGSLPIAPPFDGTARSSTVIEVQHLKNGIKMPVFYWGGQGINEAPLRDIGAEPLTKIILPNGQEKIMSAQISVGKNGGTAFFSSYHFEAHSQIMIWDWMSKLAPKGHEFSIDMPRLRAEIESHPNYAYLMSLCCILDDIGLEKDYSFTQALINEGDKKSIQQKEKPAQVSEQAFPYNFGLAN